MEAQKILIVDDDVDVINVITTILENEGYEVISAFDKDEGLQLARDKKPDLAILDVMMTTHYEGFEMAKELSEDRTFRTMPVLMQTSIDVLVTTKESVREMAREFRADPHYSELQVILVRDVVSGNCGVDYLTEDGRSIWLPVNGFLRKPVDARKLLYEIKAQLEKQAAHS
ncbi:MAG TPA: response regulator [Bacteroidales bacterium]|nr:response regulator [Bacteroidales bacterium]HNS47519.1 response regulator [Bacteroidales bacterium]